MTQRHFLYDDQAKNLGLQSLRPYPPIHLFLVSLALGFVRGLYSRLITKLQQRLKGRLDSTFGFRVHWSFGLQRWHGIRYFLRVFTL